MERDGGIIAELCDGLNVDALQLVSKVRKLKRAEDEASAEGSLPAERMRWQSERTEGLTGVRTELKRTSNVLHREGLYQRRASQDSCISLLNYVQSLSTAQFLLENLRHWLEHV
ncbi:unnamed protein product [Heligmosomoides polygyrus]|uniref:Uncharacterized protein n=1 Tax=Heligmosomoides polygyrus TaxID=6339 RepID=A0A183F571_HELPZ|nr:unnamed protein product [Heligmosomoides polygyrus]